jgi:hypothetical protein
MTKKDLLNKSLREGEIKILDALKNGKPQAFTDLKKTARISGPSLNDNRKRLQKRGLINRDIDSSKYIITREGHNYLAVNSRADTMRDHVVKVEPHPFLPIDSIVALNIPGLPKKQSDNFMAGTPNVAELCFNQFLRDLQNKESCPASGVVVYTASIDVGKVKDWLDTAEGKKYVITKSGLDEEKES